MNLFYNILYKLYFLLDYLTAELGLDININFSQSSEYKNNDK